MLQFVQSSTCLRIDGDIMVQHSGCCLLAVEVEVRMLSQVDRCGSQGAGLHADAQLIAGCQQIDYSSC